MTSADSKAVWPGWTTTRLIGRGSFGTVYEIERDVFGRKESAALKVITIPQSDSDIDELYDSGYDEASVTETFKTHLRSIVNEYSLMREMNGSANVVNCDDFRVDQHDDGIGWDIFIKMELLTPLTKAIGQQPSDEQVIRIAKDMCKALILCEKYGIIHRDIKPQNIFVSKNGDYKLGDFGIAKTIEKTSGGTKIGTYKYMAPEVYNNRPYNLTADIYSLGLVLHWLLNERRQPFMPLPPAPIMAAMEEEARLRRFNGEKITAPAHGSRELQRIVLKACAYDPKDRYQHASEMLRDLEAMKALDGAAVEPKAEEEKTAADTATNDEGIAEAEETDNEDTLGAFGKRGKDEPKQKLEDALSRTDSSPDNESTAGAFWEKKTDEPKHTSETSAQSATGNSSDDKEPSQRKKKSSKDPLSQNPKNEKRLYIGIAAVLAVIAVVFLLWKGTQAEKKTDPTIPASTKTATASTGTEGVYVNGIKWSLDKNGVLTISGQGEIPGTDTIWSGDTLHSKPGCPWNSERSNVFSIVIENGITRIGEDAFSYCDNLARVSMPNSVNEICSRAFRGCKKLKELSLSDTIKTIQIQSFESCGFETIDIPESVETIDAYAFAGCTDLSIISIPNSVTTIGKCAFNQCSSLTRIIIPDSIKTIDAFTFWGCKSLQQITIPSTIMEIKEGAFLECDSLTDVYYSGSEKQWEKIAISDTNIIHVGKHFGLSAPMWKPKAYAEALNGSTVRLSDVLTQQGISNYLGVKLICGDGYEEIIQAEDVSKVTLHFFGDDRVDFDSMKYPGETLTDVVKIEVIPNTTKAPATTMEDKITKLKVASVGDTVLFGAYEQDGFSSNGTEEIEWIVLAKEENKAFVISRYILDCQPFNSSKEKVSWDTCSLRKWLNEEFFDEAFSSEEKKRIISVKVTADKNLYSNGSQGKDTTDKVFLLSMTEVNQYLNSNNVFLCQLTEFCNTRDEVSRYWRLRTIDDVNSSSSICIVPDTSYDSKNYRFTSYGNTWGAGIRPALWIDFSS